MQRNEQRGLPLAQINSAQGPSEGTVGPPYGYCNSIAIAILGSEARTLSRVDLDTALRNHGCRVTRARRVVWDVLSAADEHLSAPMIIDRVHAIDRTINESSVYRTLTVFSDVGLVRESRLDEAATWEPFHDDAAIHLMCAACGVVLHHDTDLVNQLRRSLEHGAQFAPTEIDVRVVGRCADCNS